MAKIINALLRLGLLAMAVYIATHQQDPKFADKGIGLGAAGVMLIFSLVFPFFYHVRKEWRDYPFGYDNLFLSIFFIDLGGNILNLYDTVHRFDLIPHFHSPGVLAIILRGAFQQNWTSSWGLSNTIHIIHEGREFYEDKLKGTRLVNGPDDVVNDLLAGLLGGLLYLGIFHFVLKGRPDWDLKRLDDECEKEAEDRRRHAEPATGRRRPALWPILTGHRR